MLTLVGVILVALIAAVAADRRQEKQLRHERWLVEAADLRLVIDDASEAIDRTIQEGPRLAVRLINAERHTAHVDRFAEAGHDLRRVSSRLAVRLPEGHELADLVLRCGDHQRTALGAVNRALHPDMTSDEGITLLEEAVDRVDAAVAVIGSILTDFRSEAFRLAGALRVLELAGPTGDG